MKRQVSNLMVEVVEGDIAAQRDIDAVVNAANSQLMPGGGVAGAIHRAAGPGLAKECRPLAPIRPGQAVITAGYGLPNRYVIHCLGPVYGRDEPSAMLLAECYQNALRLAEERGIRSIAFPSISTGVFGYPMEEAAAIAFGIVADQSSQLGRVQVVRFVLFGEQACRIHERALGRIADVP